MRGGHLHQLGGLPLPEPRHRHLVHRRRRHEQDAHRHGTPAVSRAHRIGGAALADATAHQPWPPSGRLCGPALQAAQLRDALGTRRSAAWALIGGCGAAVRPGQRRRRRGLCTRRSMYSSGTSTPPSRASSASRSASSAARSTNRRRRAWRAPRASTSSGRAATPRSRRRSSSQSRSAGGSSFSKRARRGFD